MAAVTQETVAALVAKYGADVKFQATSACLQQIVDEIGMVCSLDIGPDTAPTAGYVKYDRTGTYNRYEKNDYLKYDRSVSAASDDLQDVDAADQDDGEVKYSRYEKSGMVSRRARSTGRGLAVVEKYRAMSAQPR